VTEFLLCTVYAPLVSWGDIAVGESRGSWDRPSRSAVLGLVAGALGLTRDDQPSHDALDGGYGVAVRVDAAGTSMLDYHTAQSVAAGIVKKRAPRTRAQLLEAGPPETILSRRAYRQDALTTVAVWARAGAHWPLESLADALRRPVFVPYAGRKSNPFGLPLNPIVVEAESLAGALARRDARPPGLDGWRRGLQPAGGWGLEVAHDPCDGFPSGLQRVQRVVRRDAAAHRRRWQFAERVVEIGLMQVPNVNEGRP
jgi:CRISPR system Cascade subunit CasD